MTPSLPELLRNGHLQADRIVRFALPLDLVITSSQLYDITVFEHNA